MRLVGDNVPEQGIISTSEALKKAEELGLDLVEITAKVDPPVCKIIDYQKYLYQQKKRAKEMKANSTKVVIKEIRFGPNTDEHDFQFKLKHAIGFLQEGSKVKASVFFQGRAILDVDQGEKLLLRFALELEEYGRAEQMPKLEGKRMMMMIAPIRKNSPDSPELYIINSKKFNYVKDKDQLRCKKAFQAYRNGKTEEKTRLQEPHSHKEDQEAEEKFDSFRCRYQR